LLTTFALTATAPALAATLNVPNFNQLTLNTSALRNSGCDATSLAMVGAYYGSGKGLQQSIDLMQQTGMIGSNGYVNRYTGLSQVLGGTATWYAQTLSGNNVSLITAQLDAGYPVVVWVKTSNGTSTHWVVLTGHNGSTYYMNDPDGGAKNANFNVIYGGPTAIQGFVIYHGTPSPSPTASPSPSPTSSSSPSPAPTASPTPTASPSPALPSGWISAAVVTGTPAGSTPTGTHGWVPLTFTVTAGPWQVNIRSGATTTAAIVGKLPASTAVTCSGWEDGQSIANYWTGVPDQRWYRIGAPPVVLATMTPTSATPGSTVTLTGSGFTSVTGVTFNGVPATTFTVVSDSKITATLPSKATSGPVTVTTDAGASSTAGSFTVLTTAQIIKPALTIKLGSAVAGGIMPLGATLTASGALTPTKLAGSTVTVTIQRELSGKWLAVTSLVRATSSSGAYGASFTPSQQGTYRLKTTIAATSTHTAATTMWQTVAVTTGFVPNYLITDVNFTAVDSLTAPAIQSFLSARNTALATYETADHLGVTRSASTIIWQAAHAWSVSPKVILVTLQKEQSLLTTLQPSAGALMWAMGCGVPDTGGPNTFYASFGKQVWYGAASLHNAALNWSAGSTKVCGDGTVQPADAATYALYTYTPWIGINGGGNKLFWNVYQQYFGSPLAVDTIAPATTVSGADSLWHKSAVTLHFSAIDNPGGTGVAYTEYKIDSGPWTQGTAVTIPAPTNHANDGIHTILYRSVDDAHNVEKAHTCSVKIDTTAPTTSVSGADSGWHHTAVTLTFKASDGANGSGVAFTEYSLGGGIWQKATTLTLAALANHTNDGVHTILYRSMDNAGNLGSTQSCTVSIDTRRPQPIANWATAVARGQTARLSYYISDARPGSPTATVTIRVRDAAGHLVKKLIVDNAPVNQRLWAAFPCLLAKGVYRFFVYATDAAGNDQTRVVANSLTVR
jgi:uncharacterized protein YvpB